MQTLTTQTARPRLRSLDTRPANPFAGYSEAQLAKLMAASAAAGKDRVKKRDGSQSRSSGVRAEAPTSGDAITVLHAARLAGTVTDIASRIGLPLHPVRAHLSHMAQIGLAAKAEHDCRIWSITPAGEAHAAKLEGQG